MESILDKTDNQLINLEKLMTDIEFKQIESQVIEGLQTGNEALKRLHNILSIDKIESILDETKEGIEKQRVRSFSTKFKHFLINYLLKSGNR